MPIRHVLKGEPLEGECKDNDPIDKVFCGHHTDNNLVTGSHTGDDFSLLLL